MSCLYGKSWDTIIANHLLFGKLAVCYWKWPFRVDLPMKNGDFPWLCKRLPGYALSSEAAGCWLFVVSSPLRRRCWFMQMIWCDSRFHQCMCIYIYIYILWDVYLHIHICILKNIWYLLMCVYSHPPKFTRLSMYSSCFNLPYLGPPSLCLAPGTSPK